VIFVFIYPYVKMFQRPPLSEGFQFKILKSQVTAFAGVFSEIDVKAGTYQKKLQILAFCNLIE